MIIPKAAPTDVALEATSDGGVLLHLVVHRGWRIWLPKQLSVPLEQSGAIWLQQTVHKMMRKRVQEPGWEPNVAALLAALRAARAGILVVLKEQQGKVIGSTGHQLLSSICDDVAHILRDNGQEV